MVEPFHSQAIITVQFKGNKITLKNLEYLAEHTTPNFFCKFLCSQQQIKSNRLCQCVGIPNELVLRLTPNIPSARQ